VLAECDILTMLHHRNIVGVKAAYMWKERKILIIEEEFLHGGELLDAAQEAIIEHGFTITETFAARVGPTPPMHVALLSHTDTHRHDNT
jgi:hypothetical protein